MKHTTRIFWSVAARVASASSAPAKLLPVPGGPVTEDADADAGEGQDVGEDDGGGAAISDSEKDTGPVSSRDEVKEEDEDEDEGEGDGEGEELPRPWLPDYYEEDDDADDDGVRTRVRRSRTAKKTPDPLVRR